MSILDRVQEAIAQAHFPDRTVIDQGPFRILIDPNRSVVFVNYAVPIRPITSPAHEVAQLVETFKAYHRIPRLECAKETTPDLENALLEAGFKKEHELVLMACLRENFKPRPSRRLDIRKLGPKEDVRLYYDTANKAFEIQLPVGDSPRLKEDADKETGPLSIAIAYVNGQPAGCACLGPTWELSGVGVLAKYRRRGIASAISTLLMEEHFRSCDLVWLTAEDARAEALYRGLGFVNAGHHQSWAIVPQVV